MSSTDTHHATRPPHRLQRLFGETAWTRVRAGLSLGMVFGLGAVGTMAAWSDTATATTGVFSTSSVQLSIDGEHPTHQFIDLTRHSMLPGDTTAGAISVDNTGASDFTWSVSAQAAGDDALINALRIGIYESGAHNGSVCAGTQIGGTQNMGDSPTHTSTPLAAGASHEMCIQVTVAGDAGQDTRFKVADLTFEFTAEGL